MNAIEFKSVSEKYRIKFMRDGKAFWEELWALSDIDLGVKKGTVLGIIGQNGAGKTTLLKLAAGMLMPDKGEVKVSGRVSLLMELGAGFDPEFTGRENITINAKIYGLDDAMLEQKIDGIIEFAGLGKFIDAPIRYYSQGMYMRLAFALSIYIDPEILLIDDILAVGDEEARQKCIDKVFELKDLGRTIVVVSHDMDMMAKLCDRIIIMEKSRIAYDGNPPEAIRRYLETVGNKKGIAVLAKGGLRVVFNNGRVMISYAGTSLTKRTGGYLSFYSSGSGLYSSSLNLDWRVSRVSDEEVAIEGMSHENAVLQKWIFKIQDTKLEWKVEIKDEQVREPHIDIMLIPAYNEWVGLDKKGAFPDFANRISWQDVGSNAHFDIAAGVASSLANNLPGFIFGAEGADSRIKFFNSGYEHEARVVRMYLDAKNIFAWIKICPSDEEFRDSIDHLKQRLVHKGQKDAGKDSPLYTISSGDISFTADSRSRALKLYFKGRQITRGGVGIDTVFAVKNASSFTVEKLSEDRMIFNLHYGEPFLISQIWTLTCKSGNTLDLKIEYEFNKPLRLPNRDLRLTFEHLYENWSTVHEDGSLSANQYISKVAPIRMKYNKVSKVVLEAAAGNGALDLSVEAKDDPQRWYLGIYKHKDAEEKIVCLNFYRIIPKDEGVISPGRYVYFDGVIVLDNGIKLNKEPSLSNAINLNSGFSRIIFDQGRGRIVLNDKEITSGLGFYTSVRFSGIWYDSYQAGWHTIQHTNNTIIVAGNWPNLPISQTWRIELKNDGLIFWKAELEVFEEIGLEIQQANIMLSPKYRDWLIPRLIRGQFLDEFTHDYDIYPFRFWHGKMPKGGIAAISEELPGVLFESMVSDEALHGVLENTDSLYKARLLQYQKTGANKLVPGKYDYFEGAIKIGFKE